jgi:hypothetical protein
MRDERRREAALSPRPVSGLATHRPAFPREKRSGIAACCRTPFRVVKWAGQYALGPTCNLRCSRLPLRGQRRLARPGRLRFLLPV